MFKFPDGAALGDGSTQDAATAEEEQQRPCCDLSVLFSSFHDEFFFLVTFSLALLAEAEAGSRQTDD